MIFVTVSFWVLALDHDLQISSGAIGSVSIKDPQGTKVAIWDQVALDEGVIAYSLPLSPYALTGRWLVTVEVEQSEFYSTFEVAPGIGIGLPDVSVAEEHYVELKFGTEMRRRYKPGLPFSGKVEAMSTEKSVRVRVKVYDNTTSIYSQDIEISNGEGTFVVPAILADSDIIHLQYSCVLCQNLGTSVTYIVALISKRNYLVLAANPNFYCEQWSECANNSSCREALSDFDQLLVKYEQVRSDLQRKDNYINNLEMDLEDLKRSLSHEIDRLSLENGSKNDHIKRLEMRTKTMDGVLQAENNYGGVMEETALNDELQSYKEKYSKLEKDFEDLNAISKNMINSIRALESENQAYHNEVCLLKVQLNELTFEKICDEASTQKEPSRIVTRQACVEKTSRKILILGDQSVKYLNRPMRKYFKEDVSILTVTKPNASYRNVIENLSGLVTGFTENDFDIICCGSNDLARDLREIKGCIISTFNDTFLQDVVSKVAAMVDKQLEEKLKAQDVEIEMLKENQNKIIEENIQLRKIIDDQEQHARNLNVRIHGIKVEDGENTENLRTKVLEVFTNKLKINLVDSVIKKCHRVSSMGPSDQPPAVLVRFASDTSRSQPDEEAYVTILSTCPCERDVHYVITTDGRITDWAQRRYGENKVASGSLVEETSTITSSMEPGPTCKLNFRFVVQAVMAPVSQLLVYYVTPEGEPISDVISFDVKLFNKEVSVNIENRDWWLPDQSIDLEVIAEPSSLVCLLGGRSEATGDLRFDPRISEEPTPSPITEEVDFLEAGVSYFQRECSRRGDTGMSAISYRQRGSGAGPSGQKRRPPESLVGGSPYDQLWMWTCFNYS
ncbi:unnamed protein product [Ceutorhynchus assimilis]|uniref:Alpha-2-macroglobulin bait region domain-containing protein n=1 Tax=Ceutorhynchus assimilis TaxID=467358 RepID=A0A9N9QCE6_9CUCU|nr:unnamed protein product [Ceutorhynchus assimilis]